MINDRLSEKDLDRFYFPRLTRDKAENLLLDGEEYFTPGAWIALRIKAKELGFTEEELDSLDSQASKRREERVSRGKRWAPFSDLMMTALILVGLGAALLVPKHSVALFGGFMVLWLVLFIALSLTHRL